MRDPRPGEWKLECRHFGRKTEITLIDGADQQRIPVDKDMLRRSLRFRTHSPDGFSWGYNGSGPSQLALAVCLYLFPDEAIDRYMDFRDATVAQGDWTRDMDYLFDPERWLSKSSNEIVIESMIPV